MRRFSIQNKIVLPFILLFAVVIFIVPIITIAIFDRRYDEQFSRETKAWLQVIVNTPYIDERETDKVKSAYGAEVMVFSPGDTLNATTLQDLSDKEWTGLAEKMKLREARKQLSESGGEFASQNVTLGGKPYKVIYSQLPMGRIYCLMRPMDKIADAKRQATLLMVGVGVVVILLVALISHLIGGNLANPVKTLVQFTRRVAEGNLDDECRVKSNDEIGDLARAFNQMTQELRNSRNELIQAERLATAGKMAASFAHEIRNPLSSMRMLAQMLMRKTDLPKSRQKQSMQYILEEIERIDGIVKGLMDFARPAALELAPHDLNQALQESLNLMEANLNHHQITLERRFAPELPLVPFDRNRLKQAFMNIILNAMDAMPEGGKLVVRTLAEGEFARIDMTDTGTGIAPADLERLFEPFFTTKPQGAGLGLANARRILEQHGGGIDIRSDVGKGTTVTLRLPMRE
jgi:signal transduction histidine kinase